MTTTEEATLGVEEDEIGNVVELDAADPFVGILSGGDSDDGSEEDGSELSDVSNLAELSDSEEEDQDPLVRVGNVPREWYDQLEHLGYNIDGKAIKTNHGSQSAIDNFMKKNDPNAKFTVYDELNDRNIVLSKEEIMMIENLRKGRYPHSDFDPDKYQPSAVEKQIHPFGNATTPAKNSFVPSKWENQAVLKIIHSLRNGWMKPLKEKMKKPTEKKAYLIWMDDGQVEDPLRHKGPAFIPAPKESLPEHAESYNPPEEYVPTEEEINAWEMMDEEDRPYNFMPTKYTAMRRVPLYDNFVKERFDRCLDLYLCPRKIKHRLNIDPESLIPEIPKPSTLKPFPTFESVQYQGHTARVRSIAASPCGQWIASSAEDDSIRIWEVESGRCFSVLKTQGTAAKIAWNPAYPLLATLIDDRVELIPTGTGSDEAQAELCTLLRSVQETPETKTKTLATWKRVSTETDTRVVVTLGGLLNGVTWHRKGDYFSTCRVHAVNTSTVVHRLHTGRSQSPFSKSKGEIQATLFHNTKPFFFVATKTHIRMYDLAKQVLAKKILTPMKWISSIDIHPSGDHLIVGSYDRRVCWFDLDLSSKPYRTLKYHNKAVRSTQFHRRYPLFLSASDDGTVHVFHGMVYSDLSKDPLIVPVKILHAHTPVENLGVMDACFHPNQPWLFTAGADGTIKLFC